MKDNRHEFVIADIPGLIIGAHEGKGLGDQFLAHIERCKILLHLIDLSNNKFIEDYKTVRLELEKYGSELINKKEIIALSKFDLYNAKNNSAIKEIQNYTGKKILKISSKTKKGFGDLKKNLIFEMSK